MNSVNICQAAVNFLRCLWYPNSTRNTLLAITFVSIILSLFLANKRIIQTTDYLSILSSLSGFCLAGMAILISMPNDSLAKLNTKIEKEKHCECMKPTNSKGVSNSTCLDDLFAIMSLGVIVPLVGLMGYLLRPYFHISICVCSVIKMTILIFSILWSIHITIHFFMLRSILSNK